MGRCAKHHARLLQGGTSSNTALAFLAPFKNIHFIWGLQSQMGHESEG